MKTVQHHRSLCHQSASSDPLTDSSNILPSFLNALATSGASPSTMMCWSLKSLLKFHNLSKLQIKSFGYIWLNKKYEVLNTTRMPAHFPHVIDIYIMYEMAWCTCNTNFIEDDVRSYLPTQEHNRYFFFNNARNYLYIILKLIYLLKYLSFD